MTTVFENAKSCMKHNTSRRENRWFLCFQSRRNNSAEEIRTTSWGVPASAKCSKVKPGPPLPPYNLRRLKDAVMLVNPPGTFLRSLLILGKLKRALVARKRGKATGGDTGKVTSLLQREPSRCEVVPRPSRNKMLTARSCRVLDCAPPSISVGSKLCGIRFFDR